LSEDQPSERSVVLVHKPRGMSPVQAITRVREIDPALEHRRIGYAGRLDPLATGLLVLLLDEANKRAHEFNHLDKRYEIEVTFGVRTDTFDLLGLPTVSGASIDAPSLDAAIDSLVGTRSQRYPPYSSVRINGRPAFYWARRGEVPDGGWPEKERTIRTASVVDRRVVSGAAMVEQALSDIASVQGDFRQEQLARAWRDASQVLSGRDLTVLRLAIECSSGTFMRSIADALGERAGCAAIATVIHRTRVGPYELDQARSLERSPPTAR
jgi:tRNA pseudouridine55 synthase